MVPRSPVTFSHGTTAAVTCMMAVFLQCKASRFAVVDFVIFINVCEWSPPHIVFVSSGRIGSRSDGVVVEVVGVIGRRVIVVGGDGRIARSRDARSCSAEVVVGFVVGPIPVGAPHIIGAVPSFGSRPFGSIVCVPIVVGVGGVGNEVGVGFLGPIDVELRCIGFR